MPSAQDTPHLVVRGGGKIRISHKDLHTVDVSHGAEWNLLLIFHTWEERKGKTLGNIMLRLTGPHSL